MVRLSANELIGITELPSTTFSFARNFIERHSENAFKIGDVIIAFKGDQLPAPKPDLLNSMRSGFNQGPPEVEKRSTIETINGIPVFINKASQDDRDALAFYCTNRSEDYVISGVVSFKQGDWTKGKAALMEFMKGLKFTAKKSL